MLSDRNASHHSVVRAFMLAAVVSLVLVMAAFVAPTYAVDTYGQISIPALSLEASIVQAPLGYPSWDLTRLGSNVGYLEGTGQLGQAGNLVLAGHSTTPSLAPSVFYNLHTLKTGDEIVLTLHGTERRYVVTGVSRVEETDISVVMPTAHEQLTLLTCATESYRASSATYAQRYIVTAVPA